MSFHAHDVVINTTSGRPMPGVAVLVLMPSGAPATLYADKGGTPLVNPALTNNDGTYDFYVPNGTYTMEFRVGETLVKRVADIEMRSVADALDGIEDDLADVPPNITRASLAALKAAPTTDKTSLYDASLWTFTPGDFTGRADDVSVVKADGVALAVGAWVRQSADAISFAPAGANAITRTAQDKARERVSVLDYMTAADRAAAAAGAYPDATYAFTRAQAASRHVTVPPGYYGLINLRIQSGVKLEGAGDGGAYLKQLDPTKPALNCLSDMTTGQIRRASFLDFTVVGADAFATANAPPVVGAAPAVFVGGYGAYAVEGCRFRYRAEKVFRALHVVGTDAGNVYNCSFQVTGEGHRGEAALIEGGGYSDFSLFLTQCDTWGVNCSAGNSLIRAVTENCQRYSGQKNVIRACVEGIVAATMPPGSDGTAIVDQGFYNIYDTPELNLLPGDAGKVSYAFKGFYGTIFNNPQIIGAAQPTWPFAPNSFPTTINGGRSNVTNKLEGVFSESQLRFVTLLGDVSAFTTRRPESAGTQHAAPSGDFNLQIDVRTRAVVLDPTANINIMQVSTVGPVMPYDGTATLVATPPYDGWLLSISTTKAIATITWPTGGAYANLPTSLAANAVLRMVYRASSGKWYLA